MSRWGSRKAEQDSVFRAGGVVRVPGDSEPLKVSLSISASHVLMTSDGAELGSWPRSDVRITRIDPFSFAFVAEGDRVVFVPDDAKRFAAHPAVGGEGVGAGSTSKMKLKGRLVVRKKEPRQGSQTDTSGTNTPAKPAGDVGGSSRVTPPSPRPRRRVRRVREPVGDVARTGVWLKTIDTVRENGWFGLDRVPVHLDQRGMEHQHTFDHGAAATTGLGRRVCTVCGKIRFGS